MNKNWLYGGVLATVSFLSGCGQGSHSDDPAGKMKMGDSAMKGMDMDKMPGMEMEKSNPEAPKVTSVKLDDLLQPGNASVLSSVPVTSMHPETMHLELPALGRVGYDTRLIYTISARVSGRIEKLYVRYRYQHVHAGQRIMQLYSPELATPEQQLLFLLKNDPGNTALISAARQRLLLLGVSERELAEVERTGRASATQGVYSSYTGHIHEAGNTMPTADSSPASSGMAQELPIKEGMYVEKGQPVFQVFNTNRSWALLKLFPGDAALVRKGDAVQVVPETAPQNAFRARVDEVLPLYGKEDKTSTVRVYFDNSQKDIPIGSQVKATLYPAAVTGNWLPKAAVLSLGTDQVVFLRVEGGFRAHKVVTGTIYKEQVQVLSGLAPGDPVAQNAQFLVDSEDFIKIKD